MPHISLRQYAKHRGVALSAVQKAISSGRIKKTSDGKIDVEACDRAWDLATDASKQRHHQGDTPAVFQKARAARETYNARLAQLNYERRAKKLVDADAVKKRAFENARTLRDSLLNLPNQIAVDLASEIDPVKISNMLTIEITRCLEELATPRLEAAKVAAHAGDEEESGE